MESTRNATIVMNRTPKEENLQLVLLRSDDKTMKDMEIIQPMETVRPPVNFQLKKPDHVLKQNVFGNVKRDKRSPIDIKKQLDKDISHLMKRIRTHNKIETKILNKSSVSSLQDTNIKEEVEKLDKPESSQEQTSRKTTKTRMYTEHELKAERRKDNGKGVSNVAIKTDQVVKLPELPIITAKAKEESNSENRKQNISDQSLSSNKKSERKGGERKIKQLNPKDQVTKPKVKETKKAETKEKSPCYIVKSMTSPFRKPSG
ncbi:hypothetical protein PYW08_009830 [Mythimna loreyi]|uniref:Uncharacterized protein n=1 Tax=Mythimna loreyi TaxID=667449 RepID=A0ACC2Q9H8_9NEOP|nr:hypothetical protein PYW08_009830 [Mythimna loreyi]